MNRIAGRRALFDKMSELLADPQRLKTVQDSVPPPEPVVQFLANLELLNGVPFNYLVADEAFLPPESIRFFQVDQNWIYSLIEGAASIASSATADELHDAVTRPPLHDASRRASRRIRAHRGLAVDAPPEENSGFLLRSAVVSGWPGLEISAYDAKNKLLPVIRMDRLAPTVLLYWAEGVIDHVDIHEPSESMHFGVDILGGKILRYVTVPPNAPSGTVPGSEIAKSSQPIEQRGHNVIKIDALATKLETALQTYQANNQSGGTPRPFTSAEFALQMVEGSQSVVFVRRSSTEVRR